MAWSNEIRACKTLWTSLMALDQMSETTLFKNAGAKRMKDLTFFSATGSAAMLVGSSRVDLQACKLEYSIVSPK